MDPSLSNKSYFGTNSNPNYGSFVPANNVPNLPVRISEPQINIQVNFQTSTKPLQHYVSLNQHKILEKLDREYNASLRIDGPCGKNLFMIGFILVKDVLCNNSSIDFNDQTLLEAFNMSSSSIQFDRLSQDLFQLYKLRLNQFFITASKMKKEQHLQLDNQATAAKYLSDQCNSDNELPCALTYLGRCMLIKCLIKQHMEKTPTYEKLIRTGWEVDENYSNELLVVCCQSLGYHFTCFLVPDFGADEKLIGNGKNQVHIFDHSKRDKPFKALLFKSGDHFQNEDEFMQAGQILTRNKDRVQAQSKSPNLNWQPESIKVEKPPDSPSKSPSKDCLECVLCKQKIVKDTIYTNPTCGHHYCLYCLQDLTTTHVGLKLCYLQRCNGSLDQPALKNFIRKCTQGEPVRPDKIPNFESIPAEGKLQSPPVSASRNRAPDDRQKALGESVQFAPKRITCSVCDDEVSDGNPILFTNKECGHNICRNWFLSTRPSFEAICFNKRCPKTLDVNLFKKSLQDSGIVKFNLKCNMCHKDFDHSKVFVNTGCQHRICLTCTSNLRFNACPKVPCKYNLDQEKLFEFQSSVIPVEEDKNIIKKILDCPTCHSNTELHFSIGSRMDYGKCQNCSNFICLQHNEPVSKCLCWCPRCLGTLSGIKDSGMKNCTKCAVSYCLKCKRENMYQKPCECDSENGQMSSMFAPITNKSGINPIMSGLMSVKTQISDYQNVCNECNDFREYPSFFELECKHKICEHCILNRRDGYYNNNIKTVACLSCYKQAY